MLHVRASKNVCKTSVIRTDDSFTQYIDVKFDTSYLYKSTIKIEPKINIDLKSDVAKYCKKEISIAFQLEIYS